MKVSRAAAIRINFQLRDDCRSAIEEQTPFYGNVPLCRFDLDQVLDPGKVRDVSV
jgi:hypothetical protein